MTVSTVDLGKMLEDRTILRDNGENRKRSWRIILYNQTFTPCGRYGVSLQARGRTSNEFNRIFVFDILNSKMDCYKPIGVGSLKSDICYCISSNEAVIIQSEPGVITQKVIELDHERKTYRCIEEKKFEHNVRSHWHSRRQLCNNCEIVMEVENEKYVVWTTTITNRFVFLIPRNPRSSCQLKIFTLLKRWRPDLERYNEQIGRKLHFAKQSNIFFVINNSLYYPMDYDGGILFGYWVKVDISKLVNVRDLDEVAFNSPELFHRQRHSYSLVINTFGQNMRRCEIWSSQCPQYYSQQNLQIMWGTRLREYPHNPKQYHRLFAINGKGKHHFCRYSTAGKHDVPFFTGHPSGLILLWSKVSKKFLQIKKLSFPRTSEDALYEIAKRRILCDPTFSKQKLLQYSTILFRKN